ncbi:stathmin domain-containing protein 1 [Pseudoliparis swirei]|uniref:stathmin domain-containing protein 1 n=1 Tax=Pseudoliparis swirei TaxID=2059687 RepID=UPI0024BE6DE2|nr:stathmin domain-containing protein 1 [Pseudoliparis swirei]
MDNRDNPVLPGAVPRKLPPLTSVRESGLCIITRDGTLQQVSTLQEQPTSSEILEELLNQGIIPVGQTREGSVKAAESYSIMLDDEEGSRRKPPVRLESLKALKAQKVPSIEDIEEKIRLAEERRQSREDKLKMRLRIKSARVRGPAPTSRPEEDEDTALTPVEPLQLPAPPNPFVPLPHSQITHEKAEGGDRVREVGGDGREEMGKTDKGEGRRVKGGERGYNRGEGAERVSEEADGKGEDELTQEEDLMGDNLLTDSEELESYSSLKLAEDKEEML